MRRTMRRPEGDLMPMIKSDLGRRWTMWVDAAGCVEIRPKGTALAGSLPVFSTNTIEAAEAIRVRHCRLARDHSGLYFLNETPHGVEDLGRVSEMFRASLGASDLSPEERKAALNVLDRLAKE